MRHPDVSICLPVYNGARYIQHALQSVLEQTFENFELIISDNASTDTTSDICQDIASRDSRVRYFRSDINRGLASNFNYAFSLATAPFLMWIGHDDVMGPTYVSRCVEELAADSSAVLCFANAHYIDDTGRVVTRTNLLNPGASHIGSERFSEVLYDAQCDPVFGLMRREILKHTKLHGAYADSDRVLLAELCLHGRFCLISERLFFRRMHESQTTSRFRDRWERTLIFDPTKAGKASVPWLHELADFVSVIWNAPLDWKERYRCSKYLYWWFLNHRSFMVDDVRRGLNIVMRRSLPYLKPSYGTEPVRG